MSYNAPSEDRWSDAFDQRVKEAIQGDRRAINWFRNGIRGGDAEFIRLVESSARNGNVGLIDLVGDMAKAGDCQAIYLMRRLATYGIPSSIDVLTEMAMNGDCAAFDWMKNNLNFHVVLERMIEMATNGHHEAFECIRNLADRGHEEALDCMFKEALGPVTK